MKDIIQDLKEGDKVHVAIAPVGECLGIVRGIAPTLGGEKTYIVQALDTFPNPSYPWSSFIAVESDIWKLVSS